MVGKLVILCLVFFSVYRNPQNVRSTQKPKAKVTVFKTQIFPAPKKTKSPRKTLKIPKTYS